MNRGVLPLIVLALAFVVAFPVSADPVEVDLNVGRKLMDIGSVTVSNDADNLYVEYEVDEGWGLLEVHVDVGLDVADIEQRNGNPVPGQFLVTEEDLGGVSSHTVTISFDDIEADLGEAIDPGDNLVVAAHAAVEMLSEAACIDFEDSALNEKDEVSAVATTVGTVDFYMTELDPLQDLEIGDSLELVPEGSFPIIAQPDTKPPLGDIVAFTYNDTAIGDPYRDDYVNDDGGTGAGGNLLTDPQDTSQDELLWHAFSQGLAIVVDLSAIEDVGGLSFAAVDLDFGEEWAFFYFNSDEELIEIKQFTGTTQAGDGAAFEVAFSGPVARLAIVGGDNLGEDLRVGYAFDEICILQAEEETGWGGEQPFPGRNWATYLTYTVQSAD